MKFIINVFNDCSLKYLPVKKTKMAVKKTLTFEGANNTVINIIYVDDKKIKDLNTKYLNHNWTTDVIAFNLSENEKLLEGEIYISVDTARTQAKEFGVSLTNEILRLAVHGTLHLLGYTDETSNKKDLMHSLEDKYIKL